MRACNDASFSFGFVDVPRLAGTVTAHRLHPTARPQWVGGFAVVGHLERPFAVLGLRYYYLLPKKAAVRSYLLLVVNTVAVVACHVRARASLQRSPPKRMVQLNRICFFIHSTV